MKTLAWFPLCCGLSLLTPALFGQSALTPRAAPLGVQSCDTDCQTAETDCDLACDQVVACVEECKKASAICAQKCREDPSTNPDGPVKPPTTPAKKPAATDKKAGDKKAPPAKAPPAKAAPKAPAKAPTQP
ncbi:MAG: hypothetical protein ABI627_04685 [Polyangiaceae bacterium]